MSNCKTRFATGSWDHLFGPGKRATNCRIVIDLEQRQLVEAQEWTGLKFENMSNARFNDLAESVIDVNEAFKDPDLWNAERSDELPHWARPEALKKDERLGTLGHLSQTDANERLALAKQFHSELTESVETLCAIADIYGARTLSDLLHLQAAVVSGGFIDAWSDSSVLTVVGQLPSAELWKTYITVNDESTQGDQTAVDLPTSKYLGALTDLQ